MSKDNTLESGSPILTLWAPPPIDHPIRNHPKVRWLCRTFEGGDNSHVLPENPSDVSGSTIYERIATRIREHMEDQIALGASEATLGIFLQNLGYGTSTKSIGTPLLFRAPDDNLNDAVTYADNDNIVFASSAIYGPLTDEPTLTPISEFVENYANQFLIELNSAGIEAPGYYLDDLERLHEPWRWCNGVTLGTWDAMITNARSYSEVICNSNYRIDGGTSGYTLNEWITSALEFNSSFDPDPSIGWAQGTNLSTNSSNQMMRLRMEAACSQYAEGVLDVFKGTSTAFSNVIFSNYQMHGADNIIFPQPLPGSGHDYSDHNNRFFSLDAHAPVIYNNNGQTGVFGSGFVRMAPLAEFDPLKSYSNMATFNSAARTMQSCIEGSAREKEITPWIRGIDGNIDASEGTTPSPTIRDLVKIIKYMQTFDNVKNIIIWLDDDPSDSLEIDWDANYEAILKVYPL